MPYPPPPTSCARSTPDTEERLSRRVKEPPVLQVIPMRCGSRIPITKWVSLLLFSCSVMSHSWWPHTLAHQAPLSRGLSRQEYWSGLPSPSPGDIPDSGAEPSSPALAGRFFTTEGPGKPSVDISLVYKQTHPLRFPCSNNWVYATSEWDHVEDTCFGRYFSRSLACISSILSLPAPNQFFKSYPSHMKESIPPGFTSFLQHLH